MPDQSDYEAADEVLRGSDGGEDEIEDVRERFAQLHAKIGRSQFRLHFNLREPKSQQEEWVRQCLRGEISEDELRRRLQARAERPVDQEMIDDVYRYVEERLQAYSKALQAAAETLKSKCGPRDRQRLEDEVTKQLEQAVETIPLAPEELRTFSDFVNRVRLDRGLGLAVVGGDSAPHGMGLAMLVFRRAVQCWQSCLQVAQRSQTDPSALYSTTAADLLLGDTGPKLPQPQNIQALLQQEKFAASVTLTDQYSKLVPTLEIPEANVQITNAHVDIESLQAKTDKSKKEKDPPLLTVTNWSELAIGIDASRAAWAITPAPCIGQRFQMSEALRLRLRGTPWKRLVEELAKSPKGNTAPIAELAVAFGLLYPNSTVTEDKRAKPGKVREGTIAGLDSRGAVVRETVRKKVNDLARSLRSVVDGPKGDEGACLWLGESHVHAGFTVQYLHREDNRTFTFGARRQ